MTTDEGVRRPNSAQPVRRGRAPGEHGREATVHTFVGVDLAAAAERTGLAVLIENNTSGTVAVERAALGAEDDEIVAAVACSDRAGVDVPFGWPESFVRFVAEHREGSLEPVLDTGPHWRRGLALRATDRVVRELTGLNPLSVSTDRIAYPALRWANLAARLRRAGHAVPPDGGGLVCEVYPAAALRVWGLAHRAYKTAARRQARELLVDALEQLVPWLDFGRHRDACVDHDDVLDAVLSALVAREAHFDRTHVPSPQLAGSAHREGWIHLPTGPPTPPHPVSGVPATGRVP